MGSRELASTDDTPADSRAWGTVRYGYPLDGDAEIAGADAGVDVWGLSEHIGLSAYESG